MCSHPSIQYSQSISRNAPLTLIPVSVRSLSLHSHLLVGRLYFQTTHFLHDISALNSIAAITDEITRDATHQSTVQQSIPFKTID
jgi:hypothetical protein